MKKKSLVFTIHAHREYIWHPEEEYRAQNELLFSAISEVFLPLLNLFSDLESEGIPFKITLCISPTTCALLENPQVQQQYLEWIENVIALGEAQVASLEKKDGDAYKNYDEETQAKLLQVAKEQLSLARKAKHDFAEMYQQDLLSKFAYYAKKGNIELLATTITNCYLPLYADLPQAIQAQIEEGLVAHKHYFGTTPDGFWLPHLGYTDGIESIIRSYGFYYTMISAHGLLFGEPAPQKGIFAPVRAQNGFVFFANDAGDSRIAGDEPKSFMHNPLYRNQNRDVGFEADASLLENFICKNGERIPTGYKFWANGTDTVYDMALAQKTVQQDAKAFLDAKAQKLAKASSILNDEDVASVCCFEIDFFGQEWFEGYFWLEEVLRQIAERDDIEAVHASELIGDKFSFQKQMPFPSSSLQSGYAEDFIDHKNDWMLPYLRKAASRMIDLTARFPSDTGLRERFLNLAAKELLLAQSGDWQKMIKDEEFDDYATERFKESIVAFTRVYDSLGSNEISTEWLTSMERKHSVFPWINYRVFSEKK